MNFIEEAKAEAINAYNQGEIPVGAVIVKDGLIIGRGHNLKETLKDVTAHAEILAIKQASEYIGDWRLDGAEMYVTLEPCPMCASAIKQSRISNIYYGVESRNVNNHKIFEMICENKDNNSPVKYYSGFRKNECLILLNKFFKSKR